MKSEGKISLAKKLVRGLKPFCKRIQIAGSIRRGEKNPGDIDIVLIPKDKTKIKEFMEKKGKCLESGEYQTSWKIQGVKVEFYYTNQEEWGATLLAYSSKKGSEIGLRIIAKKQGLKLNNHGLFKKSGERIAGKTEREIYAALGRPYKKPEDR